MRIALPEGLEHAVALVAPSGEWGEPGSLAADRNAGARAVELALVAALGGAARAVVVRRRPGRPPLALVGSRGEPRASAPLAISVAHVDGYAAALVAPPGWRVGVDVERVHAVREEYRRYFLTEREREALRHLPAASCWALKEAAWKALQLGPGCAFRDVALCLDDDGSVRAVFHGGAEYAATAQLGKPWPGYVLAALWIPATGTTRRLNKVASEHGAQPHAASGGVR